MRRAACRPARMRCARSASTCRRRRRRWQSGVAAGCDSGLALQLQRRDAVGEPGGAGRLAHALSTRHARRPQGASGHQRARAGAELRRLRADQRPVPVVAVYRAALFQSVRRVQQHRHHLCRRAGGPLYPLRHLLDALDQDTMRTLRLGDTITSSLDWSRSIRIAGVQWGRNFSLRPDLVTFPVAAISASSVVPSSIALYINGVQQYSSNVPAGPSWSTRSPASPARARPPSSRATRWGAASRRRCRCTWTRACWRGACPAIRWRRASCGGGSACVRSTTTTRRPSAHRAVMAWMTR